jgi:hypothetical protein
VGFALGTLGIGLGYPGQPHVVNRFMALRDARALRDGRVIALTWAVIIYAGMITLGFAARALYGPTVADEQVLFETANRLFPPVVAAVMIAAVLSAIMSTADSQLLVAASSASHDLPRRGRGSLWVSRLVVALISVLAVLIAVGLPQTIFARVLFAWAALGAAFGPPPHRRQQPPQQPGCERAAGRQHGKEAVVNRRRTVLQTLQDGQHGVGHGQQRAGEQHQRHQHHRSQQQADAAIPPHERALRRAAARQIARPAPKGTSRSSQSPGVSGNQ